MAGPGLLVIYSRTSDRLFSRPRDMLEGHASWGANGGVGGGPDAVSSPKGWLMDGSRRGHGTGSSLKMGDAADRREGHGGGCK